VTPCKAGSPDHFGIFLQTCFKTPNFLAFSFLLKKVPASWEGCLELQKGEKTQNPGPPLPGRIEGTRKKENPGSKDSQESGSGKRTAGLLQGMKIEVPGMG
jgi:hypothetical protein